MNICELMHEHVFLYEYILSAVPPSFLKQENFHKTLQKNNQNTIGNKPQTYLKFSGSLLKPEGKNKTKQ